MNLSFGTILRVDSRKSCCPIAPKIIVYGFLAGFNLMLFIVEMTLYGIKTQNRSESSLSVDMKTRLKFGQKHLSYERHISYKRLKKILDPF